MFRPHAMCSLLWLLRCCRSCNGEPPTDLVHPDDDDALAKVQAAKAELARSCNEQMTKLEELEATLLHRGATHSGPRRLQQAGSEHSCPLESLLGVSAGVKHALRRDTKLWEKASWVQPYQSEPLAAHPSSNTVLVDIFLRLQAFMTSHPRVYLPTSIWGQGRGLKLQADGQKVASRNSRAFDALVDRMSLAAFVTAHAHLVPDNALCLEWDSPNLARQGRRKADGLRCDVNATACVHASQQPDLPPLCKPENTWTLKYDSSRFAVNETARSIIGDLTTISEAQATSTPRFDLLLCTQVFEHVADPFASALGVFRLTKPGGLVFFTAPFISIYHKAPADHWRYTLEGCKALLTRVGFSVLHAAKLGFGHHITHATLMGYGSADFSLSFLDRHLLRPHSSGRERAMGIATRGDDSVWMNNGLVVRRPV